MPIFDVKCGKCDTVFEFFKVKTFEIPICPECGNSDSNELKKQLTAPAGVYCENDSRIDPAFHW